jgi:hypothetical protein
MDNKDYQELTEFTCCQYQTYLETFGDIQAPTDYLKKLFKRTSKREEKFSKYFAFKDDMSIKVSKAIDTMPHGFLWKIFHKKLWCKCKKILEEQERLKNLSDSQSLTELAKTPEVLPAVVKRPDTDTYLPE